MAGVILLLESGEYELLSDINLDTLADLIDIQTIGRSGPLDAALIPKGTWKNVLSDI